MIARNGVIDVLIRFQNGNVHQIHLVLVYQVLQVDGVEYQKEAVKNTSPQTNKSKVHWKEEAQSSLHEHSP